MTVTATPVATTSSNTSSSSSGSSTNSAALAGISSNFNEFLTLLTTQLQNQNPLNPLDTNQFTQQLVSFAQVEQQLNANDSLTTLVSLQQSNQATQALGFVGQTVTLNGSTSKLTNSAASWSFQSPSTANAAISITNSTGQTVFSGNYTLAKGANSFSWDGKGTDGTQWPDGNYTIHITAKDTSGNTVAVSTQIVGTVSSVDLTKSPPLLDVGGQSYTISQVQSVGLASSSSSSTGS